jgi:C-terminal processing protease CtpA/Prc
VRFLSAADDGTLAFTWNGDLYTLVPGGEPVKVNVSAVTDEHENAVRVETLRDGATAFAVSPDEQEVAFIVRGDVFVASVEHGTTRRVTRTPEQERSLAWAPDGRSLYYSAERGNSWGVWKSSIAREDETHFFRATKVAEERVIGGEDEIFQPVLSPDGKKLAFLRNRDAIDVFDLATKTAKNLVPAERNYSYADGDIQYEWSPDSKWLAFTYVARRRWIGDIGVVDAESGRIANLTDTGYDEGTPHWSPDGRALFFYSDRLGRRAHGSWGADGDVFAQYLTQDAFDRASLSREDYDLLKKKEDKDKEKAEGEKKDDKEKEKDKKDAKEKPPEPVKIEFERRERRVRRATITSSPIGGFAVSPDGENVVYFAKVGEKWDLWLTRPRDHKTVRALELDADQPGDVVFGKEGKAVYVLGGDGSIVKADVGGLLAPNKDGGGGGDAARGKPVAYAAEMTIDRPAERAYMFEHAWRQVRRKFYDAKLHGVDWDAMKANYARFLPHVANNWDFAEMMSEMLGELNASHTGSGFRPKYENPDKTAALGLIWDVDWTGDGMKVAEVVPGGPCAKAGSKIAAGTVVVAIDGTALTPALDWAVPLNRKEGKPVLLDLKSADGATSWQEVVKPVDLGAEANLLYERWMDRCRAAVDKASNGKVGWVHVRGMNEDSFRKTYSEVLGRSSDTSALVLDTRFNGGGWLHDDLCGFLNGRAYLDIVPRGKTRGDFGSEPTFRWARPVAVLMSEGNYSDAHIFPYAFKTLGLGKLVGAPVAGTGTAVWWETLLDPTVYFGIPQVGMVGPDGAFMENQELQPDVLVYDDPKDVAAGIDAQLLKAVETVLAEKR